MTSASRAGFKAAVPSRSQDEADNAGPIRGHATRARFRPDIEGLRAIAVGLVIAYHAFGAPFTGGFTGVDVFFVISGFLITNLLLEEQKRAGRISMAGFYARRVRRILPASTLVVLVTLFASYHWLGFITGNRVADDAKWTAIFAANLHFGFVRTDYFGAQSEPSPLQHMWSLGVEEQFYLIWPGIVLLSILLARGAQYRKMLAMALVTIITASLIWCVAQTSVNQTLAYFSPLTRAWELGLGALVAVLAPQIAQWRSGWLPHALAFLGISGISLAAVTFTSGTNYPGTAATVPVVGSAALIAAGCANHRTIIGRVLSGRPMQWIGARSYSLYLWHWPLLVIPAQHTAGEPNAVVNTGWVLLTVAASAITYRFVEMPVRRARPLATRTSLTLLLGVLLVAVTAVAAQWQIASHYGSFNPFV